MLTEVLEVFLLLRHLSSDVDEVVSIAMEDHLGRIVEEDCIAVVGQFSPDSVFRRVVYPFCDKDLARAIRAERRSILDLVSILALDDILLFRTRLGCS